MRKRVHMKISHALSAVKDRRKTLANSFNFSLKTIYLLWLQISSELSNKFKFSPNLWRFFSIFVLNFLHQISSFDWFIGVRVQLDQSTFHRCIERAFFEFWPVDEAVKERQNLTWCEVAELGENVKIFHKILVIEFIARLGEKGQRWKIEIWVHQFRWLWRWTVDNKSRTTVWNPSPGKRSKSIRIWNFVKFFTYSIDGITRFFRLTKCCFTKNQKAMRLSGKINWNRFFRGTAFTKYSEFGSIFVYFWIFAYLTAFISVCHGRKSFRSSLQMYSYSKNIWKRIDVAR